VAQGTIALPQTQTFRPASKVLQLVPGVLLLAAIGWLGKFIEQSVNAYGKAHHLHLPNIEYVLWAILIGLAVSNTIGIPAVFRPGVGTYEFFLKTGIVLLGARFLIGDVLKLGGVSLGLVVLELAVAFTLMTFLGRWFGLNRNSPAFSPWGLRSAAFLPSSPPREPSTPTTKTRPTRSRPFSRSGHSRCLHFR